MYTAVEVKGKYIIDIFYDKYGKKYFKRKEFSPTIALETDEQTKYKDIFGKKVKLKKFEDIRKYRKFIYETQGAIPIYGDIQPEYQYISETYKNMEYDLSMLRTLGIDIEVKADVFPDPEIAAWPITSITIKDFKEGKFYVAATKQYNKHKTILENVDPRDIYFKKCENDNDILLWLVKLFKFLKPDIVVGWYSDNFDIPYIINRFDYIFEDENIKKKLSPIGIVSTEKINDKDFRNRIGGITLFDYLRLYKRYVFTPRENYKLDFIAECELKENKINYDEYDNLNELWKKNPQKYIDYNIYDVELISLLDQKLKLIDLACTIAYEARCSFIDVMGTIRVWDVILYNYLKDRNIVIPPRKDNHFVNFAGAYVKEPKPKIYKWIVSYDLNSLYPHIQQQWNVSPECLVYGEQENVDQDEISDEILNQKIKPNENYILAGNGHYFKKDIEGIIPTVLKKMYDERSSIKRKQLDSEQLLVDIKEEIKRREEK